MSKVWCCCKRNQVNPETAMFAVKGTPACSAVCYRDAMDREAVSDQTRAMRVSGSYSFDVT